MTSTSAPLGIDIDLTTDYLEERFEDEDAKCEATHRNGTPCTIHVTHRAFTCLLVNGQNVCLSGANWVISRINGTGTCANCDRATNDCWSVIPA